MTSIVNSGENVLKLQTGVYKKETIHDIDIDVIEIASKALASFVLFFTNSLLTLAVGVSKLTGFAILPTLILGHLTEKLHSANIALAKHAFAPFRAWAEILDKKNIEMIETYKVFTIKEGKLFFNPKNYAKQAWESLRHLVAPISAALIVTNAVLWVFTKPAYLGMILPGLICDGVVTGLMGLNKGLSHLTYPSLGNLADRMFEKQISFMDEALTDLLHN